VVTDHKAVRGGFGMPSVPQSQRSAVPAPAGLADAAATAPVTKPLPGPKMTPTPKRQAQHGHGKMQPVKPAAPPPIPRDIYGGGKTVPSGKPMEGLVSDWSNPRAKPTPAPTPKPKGIVSNIKGVFKAFDHGHGGPKYATVQLLLKAAAVGTDPFAPGGRLAGKMRGPSEKEMLSTLSPSTSPSMAGDKPTGPSIITPGSPMGRARAWKDPWAEGGRYAGGQRTPQQQARWNTFESGVSAGRKAHETGERVFLPPKSTAAQQKDITKGIHTGWQSPLPKPKASATELVDPTTKRPEDRHTFTSSPKFTPAAPPMKPPKPAPSLAQGALVDPFKTAAAWGKMGLHKVADKIDESLKLQGQWSGMTPAARRAAHPEWKGLSLEQTAGKGRSSPMVPPTGWSPGAGPSTAPKPPTSFGASQVEAIRKTKGVSGSASRGVEEAKKEVGSFMGHGKTSHDVTGASGSGWS
jgi:hypothetical protein